MIAEVRCAGNGAACGVFAFIDGFDRLACLARNWPQRLDSRTDLAGIVASALVRGVGLLHMRRVLVRTIVVPVLVVVESPSLGLDWMPDDG